jgi:N-acyl-L-homoserine lactone synthetase
VDRGDLIFDLAVAHHHDVRLVVTLFGADQAVRAVLAHIFNWYTVRGWKELIVVISVLGGTMLTSIGMLGEYIGKIYEPSKERPLYLVARTLDVESAKHKPASEPLSRSEYR